MIAERRHAMAAGLAALLLLAAGCASPAYRIKKNPELFAAFPPEVQAKVKEGKIEIGYTQDMVLIALGSPQRIYARKTAEGVSEIWAYVNLDYRTDFVPVHTTYWYRDSNGRVRSGDDWAWVDVGRYSERETLRIEFRDGKVTSIEAVNR